MSDDDEAGRDPVEVLVEEFFESRRRGDPSDVDDFARRVPGREAEFREVVTLLGEIESAATGPRAHPPGTRLGRFELVSLLGRGGMGAVYAARDVESGRDVALKVLPNLAALDAREIERFHREAAAAARLDHPRIVRVLDAGEDDGTCWIAMQLVAGESLDRVLRRAAPSVRPDPREVARQGLAIAEALASAHALGVLHRDVKPSNLLLDASGALWITDFGLAKTEGSDALTMSGELLGTPRYMAPEAFQGWSDPRTDVWGVGVTLYEWLAGRSAFDGKDRAHLATQIAEVEPTALRRIDPALPPALATIVHHCLGKEPASRYASARDLADDLRRFLDGVPIVARPPSPLQRFAAAARRRRRAVAIASAAAVLLVALLVLWNLTLERKNRNLEVEQQRTQANLDVATGAIDHLLTNWSEGSLIQAPALDPVRRQVLLDALALQNRLLATQPGDPHVQADVAGVEYRLGAICFRLDRLDDALAHYRAAAGVARELVAAAPADRRVSFQLIHALTGEAEIDRERGDAEHELALLQEARRTLEAVVAIGPATAGEPIHVLDVATQLACCLTRQRRALEAIDLLDATIARTGPSLSASAADSPSLRTLRVATSSLASAREQVGACEDSAATLLRALDLDARLLALDPTSVRDLLAAAADRAQLGTMEAQLGRFVLAKPRLESARDELEELARRWPTATAIRSELVVALRCLAWEEYARDPAVDSTPLLRRALEIAAGCRCERPGEVAELVEEIEVRCELARQLDNSGETAAAREIVGVADRLSTAAVADAARRTVPLVAAASKAAFDFGVVSNQLGEYDAARDANERALRLADWLLGGDGGVADAALRRILASTSLGALHDRAGRPDDAKRAWEDAAAAAASAFEQPRGASTGIATAVAWTRALNLNANLHLRLGDRAGAARLVAEAIAAADAGLARTPDELRLVSARATACADAANVCIANGDDEGARRGLIRALDAMRSVLARTPRDRVARTATIWIVDHLVLALDGCDDPAPLAPHVSASVDLLPDVPEVRYAAGCFFARAAELRSPKDAPAQDPFIAVAMEHLSAAVAAGMGDRTRLRDDPALAILQPRDDYRRWLETLDLSGR